MNSRSEERSTARPAHGRVQQCQTLSPKSTNGVAAHAEAEVAAPPAGPGAAAMLHRGHRGPEICIWKQNPLQWCFIRVLRLRVWRHRNAHRGTPRAATDDAPPRRAILNTTAVLTELHYCIWQKMLAVVSRTPPHCSARTQRTVRAAGVRRLASALELQLPALPAAVHHFAQGDGAPVAQLRIGGRGLRQPRTGAGHKPQRRSMFRSVAKADGCVSRRHLFTHGRQSSRAVAQGCHQQQACWPPAAAIKLLGVTKREVVNGG